MYYTLVWCGANCQWDNFSCILIWTDRTESIWSWVSRRTKMAARMSDLRLSGITGTTAGGGVVASTLRGITFADDEIFCNTSPIRCSSGWMPVPKGNWRSLTGSLMPATMLTAKQKTVKAVNVGRSSLTMLDERWWSRDEWLAASLSASYERSASKSYVDQISNLFKTYEKDDLMIRDAFWTRYPSPSTTDNSILISGHSISLKS